MAFKKRRKTTRFRGSHTHGRGFKKKARGSGHRGGVGMAGTGKRGDAKKTLVLNLFGNDYFGKDRTLRRGHVIPRKPVMNIENVASHLDAFVKQGIAKEGKNGYELNLSEYKLLGTLVSKEKMIITAKAASSSAIDSVKAAGGEIILPSSNVVENKVAKPAKEEKKSAPKAK